MNDIIQSALSLGGKIVIDSPGGIPAWLELQGARFCRVSRWNDLRTSPGKKASPGKKPIELEWQNRPLEWELVKGHVASGGNVGMICGRHSAGIILLDIDEDLPGFLSAFPEFTDYPRIERGHPGKGKFIVRLPAGQEWSGDKKYKTAQGNNHFLEILSTGNQGVIPPSKHPSGGMYTCVNAGGLIPTIEIQKLADIVARWDAINGETEVKVKTPAVQDTNYQPPKDGSHWLNKYLAQARPGNRNRTAFDLALQLYRDGIPQAQAQADLIYFAAHVPSPETFSQAEALAALNSAYKTAPKPPAKAQRKIQTCKQLSQS